MPKISQCEKCKEYQKELNLCKKSWSELSFDDTLCDLQDNSHVSVGRTLDGSNEKANDVSKSIRRRRSGCIGIHVPTEHIDDAKTDDVKFTNYSTKKSEITMSSMTFGILVFFLILLVSSGLYVLCYYILHKHEVEERESVIRMVNANLDDIQKDITLGCIRMCGHGFNTDTLIVEYQSNIPYWKQEICKDSLEQEFLNMILLKEESWESIFKILGSDKSKITAVFYIRQDNKMSINDEQKSFTRVDGLCDDEFSFTTNVGRIKDLMNDKQLRDKSLDAFSKRKLIDIEEYVRMHYSKNNIIRYGGISLNKDFVRLVLSFDDSQMRIGKSMLDSTMIDPNFTDKVGDRGSILKEIFAICARTHRGFTIEYLGTRNGTHHILSWNYERAMKFKQLFKLGVNPNQKSNQIGVVQTKAKRKHS